QGCAGRAILPRIGFTCKYHGQTRHTRNSRYCRGRYNLPLPSDATAACRSSTRHTQLPGIDAPMAPVQGLQCSCVHSLEEYAAEANPSLTKRPNASDCGSPAERCQSHDTDL